jgi:hypothetical protein
MAENTANLKSAVVRVGDGRGFVVEGAQEIAGAAGDPRRVRFGRRRYVITAAHCLPFLPPCHGFSYLEERTYQDLLGPLDGACTVWAECMFVDPVADIAMLAEADGQELFDQSEKYQELIEPALPLPIADPPPDPAPARLLSLDGRWYGCSVTTHGSHFLHITELAHFLHVTEPAGEIQGGMSGSPIVTEDGSAIGVVTLSSESEGKAQEGGPSPCLTLHLPAWLVRELRANNKKLRRSAARAAACWHVLDTCS